MESNLTFTRCTKNYESRILDLHDNFLQQYFI